MSILEIIAMPPFFIPGLAALKKNIDLALKE
jgi:hypothetical protein